MQAQELPFGSITHTFCPLTLEESALDPPLLQGNHEHIDSLFHSRDWTLLWLRHFSNAEEQADFRIFGHQLWFAERFCRQGWISELLQGREQAGKGRFRTLAFRFFELHHRPDWRAKAHYCPQVRCLRSQNAATSSQYTADPRPQRAFSESNSKPHGDRNHGATYAQPR